MNVNGKGLCGIYRYENAKGYTEQTSDSWTRKQDSPHEGFCFLSQTPYSPGGKAEFNVARLEHPVSEKHNHLTSHTATSVYCLGPTFLNPTPAPSIPSQIERTPTQTDTFIIYLYTHHSKKRQTISI